MRLLVIYKIKSEHARKTEEFISDFKREYQKRVEILDIDTRDGMAMATIYDITRYPAILILRDDGQVIHQWQDETFPLMSELSYYMQDSSASTAL